MTAASATLWLYSASGVLTCNEAVRTLWWAAWWAARN